MDSSNDSLKTIQITNTSKIIREVSNNIYIIDSAGSSGDYIKTQQITVIPNTSKFQKSDCR